MLLAGLTVIWAATSLTWPFGWDHGIFAWIGDVIIRGEMPYRDGWDIKGPLSYFTYALIQLLFGRNTWGLRLFDAAATVAGTLALVHLAKNICHGSETSRWFTPLYVLWYASLGYWDTAQPDVWAARSITISVVLVVKPWRRSMPTDILAGLLLGCCIIVKPVYVVMIAVAVSAIFIARHDVLSRLAGLALGVITPIAVAVSWFLYRGAFQEFTETYIEYTRHVYLQAATFSLSGILQSVLDYFHSETAALVVPCAIVGAVVLWRRNQTLATVVIAWLAAALFCIVIQGRFFLYHWMLADAPLALLAAVALDAVFASQLSQFPAKALAAAWLAALCLQVVYHPAAAVAHWAERLVTPTSEEAYQTHFGNPAFARNAATYIRAHTGAQDRILNWSWNADILYLADRRSVSRFGFPMPLVLGTGTPIREKYRLEFLRTITATPPVYVVASSEFVGVLNKRLDLRLLPELNEFVRTCYRAETIIGPFRLYRHIGGCNLSTASGAEFD